jgi:hypothetical protein
MTDRRAAAIEAAETTHILRMDVPLNLTANPAAEGYDIEGAMRQALDLGLAIARVGTLGLLCGDVVVTMEETGSRVALGDGETPQ